MFIGTEHFKSFRHYTIGTSSHEKLLLEEILICQFFWHPDMEEVVLKPLNGSENILKMKLTV